MLAGIILLGAWGQLPARRAARAETDPILAELKAARAALDQALARRKSQPGKESAVAADRALDDYHRRARAARARVGQLEGQLLSFRPDTGYAAAGPSATARAELQALRAELQALTPAPAGLESAAAPEAEPNDTTASATPLDLASGRAFAAGAIAPVGDQDYYRFTAPAGARVWAYVDTGGATNPGATSRDSVLTLYGPDGSTLLEEDDDDGTGNGFDEQTETILSSVIAGRSLPAAGTYFLRVTHVIDSRVIDPYQIVVAVTTGAVAPEAEPNDTTAAATPLLAAGAGAGVRAGAIGAAGDRDLYSVAANTGDVLFISADNDPERDTIGTDTVIELLSPAGAVIVGADASTDSGLPAPPAEGFGYAVKSSGTYFVRVSHYSSTGTGSYHLLAAVAGQAPTDCPAVTGITPASGAAGSSVTITGTNLTGTTGVKFANNVAATFTVNSPTQIAATVPAGAVTGRLAVLKTGCAAVQTGVFTVPGTLCPVAGGIQPTSGAAGTKVAIFGTNLTGVTGVKFANNVTAAFAVTGDGLLTATVPPGAVSGPITISRADCPDAQTRVFSVSAGPAAALTVDDGTFEDSLGLRNGGTDYQVNRLTSASYPATLSRVAIYAAADSQLEAGAAITLLVGANPDGDENIDNTTFQTTPAQIQTVGQYNVYAVPAVTITSGDFVVGYRITYPAGAFPIALDLSPPSQGRSYLSNDGVTFIPVDSLAEDFGANLGIRALLAGSLGTVTSASAATFVGGEVAQESIVAAFGANFAMAAVSATTTPVPTTLGGTRVVVRDSAGGQRLAPLFFVSPGQLNFQVPPGTATGAATVTVTAGDGSVSTGALQVAAVAPGLFAANADGRGVAAATVVRVKADGAQSFEPVASFDLAQNKYVAVPIDLGPEGEQVFLSLFGTGIRGRSADSAVTARIGGVDAPVAFVGAQPSFAGLDQVNLRLPRSLAGRGEVEINLMVDGKAANVVTVAIK